MPICGIAIKAKPSHRNRQYFEWQTATICVFLQAQDLDDAMREARSVLAANEWEFLAFESASSVLSRNEARLRGVIEEALDHAASGGIAYYVFPDDFGAGRGNMPPMLPVRITEEFMDKVVADAGGRRLTDDEKLRCRKNADYLLGSFVLELKDLQEEAMGKRSHQEQLARLFCKYFPRQRQIIIDPRVLSDSDYLEYLNILGRPIQKCVQSASKQIRDTKEVVGDRYTRGGIVLLNTGLGSFPHRAFAAQVERYASKDSSQIDLAISISVWCATNGFDTQVLHEFSPHEPEQPEIKALRECFCARFERMMTDLVTGKISASDVMADPSTPVAFQHNGIDFGWIPPRVPFSWDRDAEDPE